MNTNWSANLDWKKKNYGLYLMYRSHRNSIDIYGESMTFDHASQKIHWTDFNTTEHQLQTCRALFNISLRTSDNQRSEPHQKSSHECTFMEHWWCYIIAHPLKTNWRSSQIHGKSSEQLWSSIENRRTSNFSIQIIETQLILRRIHWHLLDIVGNQLELLVHGNPMKHKWNL